MGKLPTLEIENLDDGKMTDCFTSCPINAVSALFLRQAGATLTADPHYKMLYQQHC